MNPAKKEMINSLCIELQRKGYTPKINHTVIQGPQNGGERKRRSTFDLSFFDDCDNLLLIVSVKDSMHFGILRGRSDTRQVKKYTSFKVPVIFYTAAIPQYVVLESICNILEGNTSCKRQYAGLTFCLMPEKVDLAANK